MAGNWRQTLSFVVMLLLCPFVFGGCLNSFDADDDSPNGRPYAAETVASLTSIINNRLAPGNIPGAIVGIWRKGYEPLFLSQGKANLSADRTTSPGDYFRMASNSKMFTATAILILADEGKIRLDDLVANHLPAAPHANAITIRQLANHTSGLADYTKSLAFWDAVHANPLRTWAPEELLDFIRNDPLAFPPGSKHVYTNSNYLLLGQLVEAVSGKTWERFVTDRIIAPLGLAHTSCPKNTVLPEPHLDGYVLDDEGNLMELLVDPSFAWAAGGMVSTMFDMKLWLDALRNGSLLSRDMAAERMKWVPAPDSTDSYGFGIENLNNEFFGHSGSMPGYNSFLFTSFDGATTVVVVTNIDPGATQIGKELISSLKELPTM